MQEKKTEIHSWFIYNNYFKGSLESLQLRNKGEIKCYLETEIPLYTKEGEFYKNEYKRKWFDTKDDIQIEPYYYRIVQINYNFYIVPVAERLEIQEGRRQLISLLMNYGIKGFNYAINHLREDHHHTLKRFKYIVERPLEMCFYDEYRLNTKSFINFDYKAYIENYNKALINYPYHKDEIERLKKININIICDFYDITEKQLSHKNFNRFEHAIKVLNKKIYQKSINK